MATFSIRSVDVVCQAAAHRATREIELHASAARAVLQGLVQLHRNRKEVDRLSAMSSKVTIYGLNARWPAVKAFKKWVREPMKPHHADFDAAWGEAN